MVHRPHPAFVLFLDSLQAKSGPAGACSVLSAHDNMALAQDSIGWAAWRGRGQRELSGPSPPGMVLSHPLAPPHQLQGALSGLQGWGPGHLSLQPPHGLTGPPLPHLIQGLQCHGQGGILQHGWGPCNRQLLPSMRPLGSWRQARCHCRILGRKASLPDGRRPPGNRACYLDKVGARESVQERKPAWQT